MRSELRGWIPYQLRPGAEATDCQWLYVGENKFTDPFFEDTIARCRGLPENSDGPRLTRLDELCERAREIDALEPSAFIFHVSRCGSTLVSQLLGLDESCATLSEVPFFDQLLRARYDPRMSGTVNVATHFPAAMRWYGQRRWPRERFLFVKFDSWHVRFQSELRTLYPHTPFILLYREPAAVIRSHRQRPGMHAVRGLIEDDVFHFSPREDAGPEMPAAHLPRVLAFYYESFLEIARTDARSLLVAYKPNMIPAVESIAHFSGIEISPAHREQMRERARFQAKHPQEEFQGTPADGAIEPEWRDCLAKYEALENFRLTR